VSALDPAGVEAGSAGILAPKLVDQGWRGALPILPPDASPAPGMDADTLKGFYKGRGKAPGRWTPAGWSLLPDWRNHPDDADTVEIWSRWPDVGIGMRCCHGPGPQIVAIDVDVPHPEAAAAIMALLRARLAGSGAFLARVGQAPKFAVPVRVAVPMRRQATAEFLIEGYEKACRVEVLGKGQQFVVAGVHPATGRPYAWSDDLLWTAPDELPALTVQQVLELVAECGRVLARFGKPVGRKGGERGLQGRQDGKTLHELRAYDPVRAMAAARHVHNVDWSRADFVTWIYSLRGALGPRGWPLARDFAAQSAKQTNPETVRKIFADATKAEKRGELCSGAGTVLWVAGKEGWKDDNDQPDPEHSYYRPDLLDAAAATDRLRHLIREHMGATAIWNAGERAGSPPMLGIKITAGTGKTDIAVKEIVAEVREGRLRRVLYLVPTVELAVAVEARFRAEYTKGCGKLARILAPVLIDRVEGRVNGKEPAESLCRKHELAAAIGAMGEDVKPTLCKASEADATGNRPECEHAKGCRYLMQLRHDNPALIRIATHAALASAPDALIRGGFDLIVVDEGPLGSLVDVTRLEVRHLGSTDRWSKQEDEGEKERHERAAATVAKALAAIEAAGKARELATFCTAEEAAEVAEIEEASVWQTELQPDQPLAEQRKVLARWQAAKKAMGDARQMARFWRTVERAAQRGEATLRQVTLRPDPDDAGRPWQIHLHERKRQRLPVVSTLLLDASLDEREARTAFAKLVVEEISVRRKARVTQITDRPVSKTMLLGSSGLATARSGNRLDELQRLIEGEFLAVGGLLVAPKAVLARLKAPASVTTAHYGGLRGIDSYKNCNKVVLIGRLEPAPGEIEDQCRAIYADDPEPLRLIEPDEHGRKHYPRQKRRMRMADGAGGPVVLVSYHPDPRVNARLEQVREREIEQALDRLRLIHRVVPAEVVIVSNVVLDVDVSEVTTWAELAQNRALDACRLWGGVFLHSPSEQARCAPGVWPTEGAAKQWQNRNKGTNRSKKNLYSTSYPYSAEALAAWRPYPDRAWPLAPGAVVTAVTYRLPGQRGPHPHRAYLPGTHADAASARAALEAVVGAVAKLELAGTVARIPAELPTVQAAPAEESAPATAPLPVEERARPAPPAAPVSSWRKSEIELPPAAPPPDPVPLLRREQRRLERRNAGKVDPDALRSAFVSELAQARERRGLPKIGPAESYPIFDRAMAAIRSPLRAVPPPLQRGSSPPIIVRVRHGARVG
jgi:hypothetical protein